MLLKAKKAPTNQMVVGAFLWLNYLAIILFKRDLSRPALLAWIKPFVEAISIARVAAFNRSAASSLPAVLAALNFLIAERIVLN